MFTDKELSELIKEKYEVLEFIDKGGQASVWKVKDLSNDKILALKVYDSSGTFEKRITREIKALKNIDSEFVLKLEDYGYLNFNKNDYLYYCTEYIKGESLKIYLENNNNIEPEKVKQLILNISSAIDELWKYRIVHRDIKPGNILMKDNNFILIDLGVAKHLDEETLTAIGRTLGTLNYMSPEQLNARKYLTLKSDYFSLGITAYEALCGKHPFLKRLDSLVARDPYPVDEKIEKDNPKLLNCIRTLLNKRPIDRFKSHSEITKELT